MGRMAADMISLRTQLVALQTENSRLRTHLAEHEDPGLDLLRDTDLDVMTKAEMADRIASLSCRLSCERSQSAAQSDRILQLQNQLIRKNDSEKELLKLKAVLQRQPGFGQQEQRRMRELEATVRHQGKVIERMERAQQSYHVSVKNKPKTNVGLAQRKGNEMAPAAESAGLRQQMFRAPQPPTPSPPHKAPPPQPQAAVEDA
ncbi:coiled-coil domain-containing protein 33 [Eucyclogobius newberryi]|uniref:coiled-coil domain-containing protein 33 n=1 Tax=Eucyclogobius newberryi TaxID=166745 RepID=UPI003B5B32CF